MTLESSLLKLVRCKEKPILTLLYNTSPFSHTWLLQERERGTGEFLYGCKKKNNLYYTTTTRLWSHSLSVGTPKWGLYSTSCLAIYHTLSTHLVLIVILINNGRLSSFFLVYKEKPYILQIYDFELQTLISLYRTENCSRLSRVFLIRCPWDSNPRTEVLQTCTIDHSVRAPYITLFLSIQKQQKKSSERLLWFTTPHYI